MFFVVLLRSAARLPVLNESPWSHGQGTRTAYAAVFVARVQYRGQLQKVLITIRSSTSCCSKLLFCAGAGLFWRALEVLQSASRGSHIDQDVAWDIYHRLASGEYHITSVSASTTGPPALVPYQV